ncbi:MAG: hypothetical protein AB4080_03300 [Trichodesmium sp.]
MSNNTPIVEIDLTPEYKRNLRKLSKKYRRIRLDTQPVIEEIQKGNFLGVGQQPVAQPSPHRNG